MDKLKPILAQKFWIFFAIVLILPVTGYFMTKGQLAAQIKTRTETLDGTFGKIPAGTDSPNEQWIAGGKAENEKRALHNRRANEELWLKQKERMTWPKDIAGIMEKAEYFKDLTEAQRGDQVLFRYQRNYQTQIRNLWEIVDPLDDGMNLRDSDKRRKIAFAMADLHQVPPTKWDVIQPTFKEVWEAQEDIWLQTELLQAVARLNTNAISQGDAFVKQLGKIQLFGGSKASGDAPAAGTANSSGGPGGEMPAFGGLMPGMGGGRKESASVSVEINLAEEFTVSLEPTGGGNAMAAFGGGADSGSTATATGGAAGGAKTDVKRYIDDIEDQPYKRRGFYIKLVMDHRKVPDLIAELMNSPFPVEIVRVQQVWLSDSGTSPTGGGSPFMAGAGGSGSPFGNFQPQGTNTETSTFAPTDDTSSAAGFGGSGGSTTRPGASGAGSAAALADPNLAQVAILGVWTLYRPPAPAADAGQPVPSGTTAPAPTIAATPADATQSTSEPTAETKPTTAESTEAAADETKKPDDGDTPKAEPVKSEKEKSESEADKPAAEKAPPKDESSEKSESETK